MSYTKLVVVRNMSSIFNAKHVENKKTVYDDKCKKDSKAKAGRWYKTTTPYRKHVHSYKQNKSVSIPTVEKAAVFVLDDIVVFLVVILGDICLDSKHSTIQLNQIAFDV